LDVEVETEIPLCSGLGSSAAAVAAGFRLFETMFGPQPIEKLLAAGCAIEGHPENVAASLVGGLVTCCQRDDGSVIALPAPWPRSLRIIVATPEVQLETRRSRAILPQTVPLSAAVSNIQRVALLLEGLRTRNYAVLSEALRDQLHQPSRCAIVPALDRLLELRRPAHQHIPQSRRPRGDAHAQCVSVHVTRAASGWARPCGLYATRSSAVPRF